MATAASNQNDPHWRPPKAKKRINQKMKGATVIQEAQASFELNKGRIEAGETLKGQKPTPPFREKRRPTRDR